MGRAQCGDNRCSLTQSTSLHAAPRPAQLHGGNGIVDARERLESGLASFLTMHPFARSSLIVCFHVHDSSYSCPPFPDASRNACCCRCRCCVVLRCSAVLLLVLRAVSVPR